MLKGHPDFSTANRILVVKLSSLGDVIHATPCLKAIRRSFPKAEIVMAVDSRFAPVVRHNPNLDVVIESQGWMSGTLGYFRWVLKELAPFRDKPFELAVDLQGTPRSAAWIYLSRSRFMAGRGGWRPGWDVGFKPDLSRHAVRVCADIARLIGVELEDLETEIHLAEEDDSHLVRILTRAGLPLEGFILINPFSRWISKAWPVECYAELVARLRRDPRLPVVISGGPGEEADAVELLRLLASGSATSLVGQLSLGEALCLYRRARVFVTGDTGPMHAAAALGTPTVALFGPTLPERTGPWGTGHLVIHRSIPTFHHAYRSDLGRSHIRAIDVETVHRAVLSSVRSVRSKVGAAPEPV